MNLEDGEFRRWKNKMSDYGIKPKEFETIAKNAKDTIGGLFICDRTEISIDDCVAIYRASYK